MGRPKPTRTGKRRVYQAAAGLQRHRSSGGLGETMPDHHRRMDDCTFAVFEPEAGEALANLVGVERQKAREVEVARAN